ncbi:hypothetical protein SAMN05216223_101742 [Actinacidiphila yanglinensis]|uniref:Uncharacterized protein n=1 Tax=Actinacidiphila yanglinensis TaxID=310779 RepID=A0A1H5U1T3_9ACTN|nr:hypothetical protein [Actinacidiphila yanglinensis]SEF69064.1 hypothetical protein SAMN05216223_101742 [Actinacidiphila yanglinensis]
MTIDWHALGTVLAVTLLSTVGLVGVFTLGIVGMSRPGGGGAGVLGRTAAYVCFAACAAAVAYGIDLIAG